MTIGCPVLETPRKESKSVLYITLKPVSHINKFKLTFKKYNVIAPPLIRLEVRVNDLETILEHVPSKPPP